MDLNPHQLECSKVSLCLRWYRFGHHMFLCQGKSLSSMEIPLMFNKLGFWDLVLSLRRLVGFIGEDRLKELKRFLGDLIMHFSSNEVGVVIA